MTVDISPVLPFISIALTEILLRLTSSVIMPKPNRGDISHGQRSAIVGRALPEIRGRVTLALSQSQCDVSEALSRYCASIVFFECPRFLSKPIMSQELRNRIFSELDDVAIIDPHTHINPLEAASANLAEILGYHYYTELAHSSGLSRESIEAPDLDPQDKVRLLFQNLGPLNNTIQYSWFVEIAKEFLDFDEDVLLPEHADSLWETAATKMGGEDWESQVIEKSRLTKIFLTNDFDDPLQGFDTDRYVPCLRTDDLVFHFSKKEVRERLQTTTSIDVRDSATLKDSLKLLFVHFTQKNARACAISLPPSFAPKKISEARVDRAIAQLQQRGEEAETVDKEAVSLAVFWQLAELCREFKLPFDLMIGVNRSVYPKGVFQGQDLYDSRVSLIQYQDLFNAFPEVVFPVSVLASVTNQELTSYAWIFPNVITHGHWWYSNTPAFIEADLAARLEAVPRTKQIGYYSDMYKLEFALPKFRMYKRILAKVLAERFVLDRHWGEERAVDLGLQVLQRNSEQIFFD